MSKRRARKTALGISLFPFLSVLICTMGSLIVLLVVVVQQARLHAASVAAHDQQAVRQASEEQEQRRIQAEDQAWRAGVLQEQREEIRGQLAERRLQLAHLEDHIRELEQRWNALKREADDLRRLKTQEQGDIGQVEAEQQRLSQAVAEAERELREAREEAARRPPSYSIIPYPGPNGTTRRPIYIECTESGIILQPENIVLRPEDFDGPLGPGNPLDAALRTVREYLARVNPGAAEEPYPLLIVRSNGIVAYMVARGAMSSWEEEFGYELVSQDLVIKYPPPDPHLAALLQQAVRDAQQRQERLRMAMPSIPRSSGFVVGAGGRGIVPVDGDGFTAARGGGESGNVGPGSDTRTGFQSGSSSGRDSAPVQGHQTASAASGTRDRAAAGPSGDHAPRDNAGSAAAAGAAGNTAGNTAGSSPQAKGPGGNQGSGQAGGQPGGQPGGFSNSVSSFSATRGPDWALRNKSPTATGYRRPLRAVCEHDELILLPESGMPDTPRAFAFDDDATAAVDRFVEAVQKRTERWGLPPLGGYWRPELVVDVAPNAAERFELLQLLLRNSGIELKGN